MSRFKTSRIAALISVLAIAIAPSAAAASISLDDINEASAPLARVTNPKPNICTTIASYAAFQATRYGAIVKNEGGVLYVCWPCQSVAGQWACVASQEPGVVKL